jgi:peptidoglycan/LPS O-acetylase OafA/YrhL
MNRNLVNDILKLILAIMVVGLHTDFLIETSTIGTHLTVNGIFRTAVPIFFVINGYYLSSALKDKQGFIAWAKRITLTYAFWMAVYLPFYLPFHETSFLSASWKLIRYLIFGYYHLWYVCGLLYAVMLLYYLRKKSDKVLAITAVSLFLVGAIIQYYIYYNKIILPYYLYRHFLFFAFSMVTAGYLIRRGYGSTISGKTAGLLVMIGYLGLFIESAASLLYRTDNRGFDIYLSFILLCPLVFMVTNRSTGTIGHDHLSRLSSAIYFLHPLFIWVAGRYFHIPSGTAVFIFSLTLCLVFYYPMFLISKKLKFIL